MGLVLHSSLDSGLDPFTQQAGVWLTSWFLLGSLPPFGHLGLAGFVSSCLPSDLSFFLFVLSASRVLVSRGAFSPTPFCSAAGVRYLGGSLPPFLPVLISAGAAKVFSTLVSFLGSEALFPGMLAGDGQ